MNSRRILSFLFVLLSALYLQGCGSASESPSENSGGGNSIPGGTPPGTTPVEPGVPVVNLRVEGTSGIAGESVAMRMFRALLPASAVALTNQKDLKVSEILVVRVDEDGNTVPGGPVLNSDYSIKFDNPDGSHSINFNGSYTSRIDLVIQATLTNGAILRRSLPSTPTNSDKKPHGVNVATEFAIRKFFEAVDDEEFQTMLPCASNIGSCPANQVEMKLVNWQGLFEGAVDFEISIPTTLTLEEALAFLETNVAFTRYVDKSIETIRKDKIGGVTGIGTIPDPLKTVIGTYNAVSFGMGLSQGNPDTAQENALLNNWTTSEAVFSNAEGVTNYYPYVSVSNLGAAIVSTLLTGDLPMLRNSLTQDAATSFKTTLSNKTDDERNFLGVTGAFTSLTTKGFYDYGVIQTQSTTGKGTSDFTGWLTNPYFSSLYDATAQASMLDARVTDGLAFALSGSTAPFTRGAVKEELNTFSFVAYSKRTDDKPTTSGDEFTTARIAGNQYGVVSLTQKFSETNPVIRIQGAIHHWNALAAQLQESQPAPTAGDLDLFKTWTMSRDSSNVITTPASSVMPTTISRGYEALPSTLFDKTNGLYESINGRIGINATGGETWDGIAEPGTVINGTELISFVMNTASDGQGIGHAVKLQTTNLSPLRGDTYRLVGNGFGMSNTENRLFHIDNSQLVFDVNGSVALTLNQVKATQDVASLDVSSLSADEPTFTASIPQIATNNTLEIGSGVIKNSIRMDFGAVSFEGFVSDPNDSDPEGGGRLMILLMRQGDSIGLVYALREKNLEVE